MGDQAIRVLLQAITGPYEAAMARASAKTASFGTAAQGAGKKTKGLEWATGGLSPKLLAGGGLIYGLKMGADKLMAYEDGLVGVSKTTGLTGEGLHALGNELTVLARNIEGSAEDMLGIAQSAAQLGVASGDIVKFTETVAGIASATDLSADAAATGFARFSNIMGEPISNVDRLGSTIVGLGNTMATTEPEILSMAMRVASAGRAAGLTSAEVLGLASAASSLGLEAEAGGTALSQVLMKIEAASISGGDSLDTFAGIAGVSARDFANSWESDPVAALDLFLGGLDDFANAGGNTVEILDALGLDGLRVSDALRRMAQGQDVVSDALRKSNPLYEANRALADEVELANSRASVAVDNLGDAWDDLVRTVAGGGGDGEGGAAWVGHVANGAAIALDAVRALVLGFDDAMALIDGALQPFAAMITGDKTLFDESWMGANYQAAESLTEVADRLGLVQTYSADTRTELGLIGAASGAFAGTTDNTTAALDRQADATAEVMEKSVALADKMLAAVSPIFAFAQATRGVEDAELAAAEAVKEHGVQSREAEDAALSLVEAHLRQDDAALRVGNSAESATEYIDGLTESERLAGESAELATGRVEGLGTAADGISGTYGIYFDVQTRGMTAATDRLNALAARHGAIPRARGGPVDRGGLYLVGEEGPELFSPETAGRITPAGPTSRLMSAGPGSGVGAAPSSSGGSSVTFGDVHLSDGVDVDLLSKRMAFQLAMS